MFLYQLNIFKYDKIFIKRCNFLTKIRSNKKKQFLLNYDKYVEEDLTSVLN